MGATHKALPDKNRDSRALARKPKIVHRAVDVLGSLICLVLSSPILFIVALLVRMDGGPALYRQTRAGLNGQLFQALKFRSMRVHNTPSEQLATFHGQVTGNHPMVTSIGRWIRRFKVDELPQAWNVLRGDMSLVGPRPTIPEQIVVYTEFQWRRLHVRPGMTGWAQVNGGIELTWPERIMLDVWYAEHQTVMLNLWILCRTISVIVSGEIRRGDVLTKAAAYARRSTGMAELVWPQGQDER